MSGTIQRFLRQKSFDEGSVRRFLAANRFPIVEDDALTFVYFGDADGVYLQHFIQGLPTSRPFKRADGSQLWYLVLKDIPERSRIQYKFDVVRGNDHQWILDPFNSAKAFDPFGANSVCHSRGIERPDWTFHDPLARPGEITEISLWSEAFRTERRVRIYKPARFRPTRRYPLLIVHDGSDYLRFSSLKVVLDNLIHRLEIPPMIVALTDAGERLHEYPDHPPHARFLTEELLPRLENDFPLRGEPAARGLLGASFGGVAALSCAWRYQGVYGRLLLQSGSFAFTDIGTNPRGPTFEPVVKFVNAFRENPGRPAEKIFVSCGTYESLIYENRSLVPFLQKAGMDVRFVEARDGHNWENWRDRLREGLSWLFPGPLWMVYE